MAALLHLAPRHGAVTAPAEIVRLRGVVQATLNHHARRRPALTCHWQADADGRLSCHWDVEVPAVFPVSPS